MKSLPPAVVIFCSQHAAENGQPSLHPATGCFTKIWRFPEIGVPRVIILFSGIFPYKPSSYWGTPMTMETPICGTCTFLHPEWVLYLRRNGQVAAPGVDHDCFAEKRRFNGSFGRWWEPGIRHARPSNGEYRFLYGLILDENVRHQSRIWARNCCGPTLRCTIVKSWVN